MKIAHLMRFGIVALLPLSANAQHQRSASPMQAQRVAITAYAKAVDQFTERNPDQRRIFGNVAGETDQQDKWREFQSAGQMAEENLDETVAIWLKHSKVVAAYFSFTSPSGDWYHYVNYYFRSDGSLAMVQAQLNTFHGDVSAIRTKYYGAKGKLLRTTSRILDLNTQKPKRHPNFQDEPIPIYATVGGLPFSKLLSGSNTGVK